MKCYIKRIEIEQMQVITVEGQAQRMIPGAVTASVVLLKDGAAQHTALVLNPEQSAAVLSALLPIEEMLGEFWGGGEG